MLDQRCVVKWKWKSYPSSDLEVSQVVNLHRRLPNVKLNDEEDKWVWAYDTSAEFSVKEIRKWLKGADSDNGCFTFSWCKWIPNKCNVFWWRVSRDRIPTACALRRRNVNIGDGLCVFCGEVEETVEHLFTACRLMAGVWNSISNWCNIAGLFVFCIRDILQVVDYLQISEVKKEAVFGILILTCWRVWKARNDKIFSNIDTDVVKIVADVKSLGYLWYNSRRKERSVDWKSWCNFSFNVM
ncbi:putative reverse transcriptase zinc-binding domain-containing protein [Helianthus annuus]|nr:putative reverse transcriptase zinc-binding domain-containing protein [Helianthus annuus]